MHTDIKVNKAQQLQLTGELNFDSVVKLRELGCHFIMKHANPTVDFKNVIVKDNSALALLIAWIRFAKQHQKTITFVNIPKQLLDMAKLSDLENILIIGE